MNKTQLREKQVLGQKCQNLLKNIKTSIKQINSAQKQIQAVSVSRRCNTDSQEESHIPYSSEQDGSSQRKQMATKRKTDQHQVSRFENNRQDHYNQKETMLRSQNSVINSLMLEKAELQNKLRDQVNENFDLHIALQSKEHHIILLHNKLQVYLLQIEELQQQVQEFPEVAPQTRFTTESRYSSLNQQPSKLTPTPIQAKKTSQTASRLYKEEHPTERNKALSKTPVKSDQQRQDQKLKEKISQLEKRIIDLDDELSQSKEAQEVLSDQVQSFSSLIQMLKEENRNLKHVQNALEVRHVSLEQIIEDNISQQQSHYSSQQIGENCQTDSKESGSLDPNVFIMAFKQQCLSLERSFAEKLDQESERIGKIYVDLANLRERLLTKLQRLRNRRQNQDSPNQEFVLKLMRQVEYHEREYEKVNKAMDKLQKVIQEKDKEIQDGIDQQNVLRLHKAQLEQLVLDNEEQIKDLHAKFRSARRISQPHHPHQLRRSLTSTDPKQFQVSPIYEQSLLIRERSQGALEETMMQYQLDLSRAKEETQKIIDERDEFDSKLQRAQEENQELQMELAQLREQIEHEKKQREADDESQKNEEELSRLYQKSNRDDFTIFTLSEQLQQLKEVQSERNKLKKDLEAAVSEQFSLEVLKTYYIGVIDAISEQNQILEEKLNSVLVELTQARQNCKNASENLLITTTKLLQKDVLYQFMKTMRQEDKVRHQKEVEKLINSEKESTKYSEQLIQFHVNNIQRERKAYEEQIRKLNQKLQANEEKLEFILDQLQKSNQETDLLHLQIQKMTEQMSEKEEAMIIENETIAQTLKQKYEDIIDKQEQDLKQSQMDSQKLQQQIQDQNDQIEVLKALQVNCNIQLQTEQKTFQTQLNILQEAKQEIEQQVEQLQFANEGANRQIQDLREQLDQEKKSHQNDVKYLQSHLTQTHTEQENLQKQQLAQQTEIEALKAELQRIKDTLNVKENEVSIKEKIIQQKDEDLKVLELKSALKDDELQTKNKQLALKDQELQGKSKQLFLKEEEASQKDKNLALKADELAEKDKLISEEIARRRALNEQIQDLETKILLKDQEINELRVQKFASNVLQDQYCITSEYFFNQVQQLTFDLVQANEAIVLEQSKLKLLEEQLSSRTESSTTSSPRKSQTSIITPSTTQITFQNTPLTSSVFNYQNSQPSTSSKGSEKKSLFSILTGKRNKDIQRDQRLEQLEKDYYDLFRELETKNILIQNLEIQASTLRELVEHHSEVSQFEDRLTQLQGVIQDLHKQDKLRKAEAIRHIMKHYYRSKLQGK